MGRTAHWPGIYQQLAVLYGDAMSDEFIRWYTTRYGTAPTKEQAALSVGLWQWAKQYYSSLYIDRRTANRVDNKYVTMQKLRERKDA
jgi:hypothetical protein